MTINKEAIMTGAALLANLVERYAVVNPGTSAGRLLVEAYMILHPDVDRDDATEAVGDMITDAMCARG